MFYLLLQSYRQRRQNPNPIPEELVCFEAESLAHAMERAQWFGIDLDQYCGGSRSWTWHQESLDQPFPSLNSHRITNDRYSNWVIVYLNDKIEGWMDETLRQEIA